MVSMISKTIKIRRGNVFRGSVFLSVMYNVYCSPTVPWRARRGKCKNDSAQLWRSFLG